MADKVPEKDDPRFRITPVQQMAAACTGAFCTSFLVTPLDVVKIRLQTQQNALHSNKCFLYCNGLMDHLCPCLSSNNSPVNWYQRNGQFTGTIDAFIKINRHEGLHSLWSGLGPTLVSAIPATVLYFVAYEQTRTRLKDWYNGRINKPGQPFWIPLAAGASARIFSATIVSPIELVRTKMQSKKLSYMEVNQALRTFVRSHGIVPGLWRGLTSTLLRDVPFSALYWFNYEGIKSFFNQPCPTFGFSFVAGAVAGSVAAICTTPFDVVKTLQQIELGEKELYAGKGKTSNVKATSQITSRARSTRGILKQIWKQNGIAGMFSGVVPRVGKVAPACAIMVATFEYGKAFFESYNMEKYYSTHRFEED